MRLPPNSPVPPADDPAGRAFTLIELLVVVSIIAIIAAMLLPALGQARRTVREQVCGNSFRTWGQGVNLYAADYDQWLPKIDMTCLPGAMLDNLAPEFVRTMPSYVPLEMWYCPYGTLKTPGPDIKTIDIPSWLVKYCWDLAGPCGGQRTILPYGCKSVVSVDKHAAEGAVWLNDFTQSGFNFKSRHTQHTQVGRGAHPFDVVAEDLLKIPRTRVYVILE